MKYESYLMQEKWFLEKVEGVEGSYYGMHVPTSVPKGD